MPPQDRRLIHARLTRSKPVNTAALLAATLAGCTRSLNRIDAQTEALLKQRSAILGQETATPRVDYRGRDIRPPTPYSTPDTANPPAKSLAFNPADEARDVEHRLQNYYEQGQSEQALQLSLVEAFKQAQVTARDFRRAEEDYILAAIRLLIEEHLWGPRFFADTSLQTSGEGDEGSFDHALDIINSLRATQRLPYGGEVEARVVWNATEQLRRTATSRYEQSADLIFSADIPLLRGAGLVAREDLIQQQRNLVYAARSFERFRRELLVDIASDYFDLISSQNRIRNQQLQLEGLQRLMEQTSALVNAGRLRAFQEELARSQVLSAQSQLANLEESYRLQLDRFKVRLGLSLDEPVEIVPIELSIPEPDSTLDAATQAALAYRLDLQNQRDRVADQYRAVQAAKNNLLPDLNLSGNVDVPTDPQAREGGVGFDQDELNYTAELAMSWPLDRKIERLNLRTQLIGLEQSQRDYEQARDNVTIDARQALRTVELSRFRLRLAEQQVQINERRLEEQIARQEEVDPQSIVDTQVALNDARNARDQARSDLKVSVLRYLLQTGQLRIGRDGWISPPEGMPPVTEAPVQRDDAMPNSSGPSQP